MLLKIHITLYKKVIIVVCTSIILKYKKMTIYKVKIIKKVG